VLDPHGITHAVVLPTWGLLHAGKIRADNDDVAAACAASGGRMLPFCTANTWDEKEALAEVERCLSKLRFRGVKFHPWVQGLSVSTTTMDKVAELAVAHNVPMLFHDGTPPFSLPSQIALLAQRHPKARIILGHTGLLEHWREAIAALRATPNLWACLCSPHLGAMKQIVQRCDLDRIVWGSDFGYGLADFFVYRFEVMKLVGLTERQAEMIYDRNPRELLSI